MDLLDFGSIKPHHWDAMTGQARQDRYREKHWRARVWMREQRQRLETAAMLRQVEELQRCALFRRQAG
jgi:hypothetical protein